MKLNLKSIISILIVVGLLFGFVWTVIFFLDIEMGKSIVATFLTISTSVVGFFIGYQTNKKGSDK